MANKKKRKTDAGHVIFSLLGVEVLVLFGALVVIAAIYVPGLLSTLGIDVGKYLPFGNQETQQPTAQVASQETPTTASGAVVIEDVTKAAVPTTAEVHSDEAVLSTVSIAAAGDNQMSRSSTLSGLQGDGSYFFYNNFVNVSDIFEAADLAVLSQSTVMAGSGYGFSEGDTFTTVTEVGDSIASAGINVVTAASPHILDQGAEGLANMITYWRTSQPDVTLLGVNTSRDEQNKPTYLEVNDITFGMINYTTELYQTDGYDDESYLVNLLNDEWLSDVVEQAKSNADFVIVFPQWGDLDSQTVNDEQSRQAQLLADLGVDLVIGNHPGVIQPAQWLTGTNGNQTLVYYSLGLFQSTEDSMANMLGGLANVTVTKTNYRTYISSASMDFLVTHYTQVAATDHFDLVTTFPWSYYSEELASQHGILTWDPQFSYSGLDALRRQVLEESNFNR